VSINKSDLMEFLRESNVIEGIHLEPTSSDMLCVEMFLNQESIVLNDVKALQSSIAPGKPFRDKRGMNVRVANHIAPAGGPDIITHMENLLLVMQVPEADPWMCHCAFEELHPFMDGNGRTGRILWAWMMLRSGKDAFALPFLHRWYYQTLSSIRVSKPIYKGA